MKLAERDKFRLIVINSNDMLTYLNDEERMELEVLIEVMQKRREESGLLERDYIVCNRDETYADTVLNVILMGEDRKTLAKFIEVTNSGDFKIADKIKNDIDFSKVYLFIVDEGFMENEGLILEFYYAKNIEKPMYILKRENVKIKYGILHGIRIVKTTEFTEENKMEKYQEALNFIEEWKK